MKSTRLLKLEDRLHNLTCCYIQEKYFTRVEILELIKNQAELEKIVGNLLEDEHEILSSREKEKVFQGVINRIVGLGPLEPFIHDPQVSEIMVNSPDQIFIEKSGTLSQVNDSFRNEDHIYHVIDRIVSPIGRRVDRSNPFEDARLMDGSRVNVIIPPLSINSPSLTIRRFSTIPFSLTRLMKLGSISIAMAHFLQASVKSKLNILISGGTGSGKTSALNALARCIPDRERLITIEDTAELQMQSNNLVSLETRPANIEGKGEVSIRKLVRNALRMRPDRIIIGEVRGIEAFDMLQAMNTGHPGSITTIHANSPVDAIRRLESMVLTAGLDLPHLAIREQIANTIDLIVQLERLNGGDRKVVSIAEVLPVYSKSQDFLKLRTEIIFSFKKNSVDKKGHVQGYFTVHAHKPNCLVIIRQAGYSMNNKLDD